MSPFNTQQNMHSTFVNPCDSEISSAPAIESGRTAPSGAKHDYWNWPRPAFTSAAEEIKQSPAG